MDPSLLTADFKPTDYLMEASLSSLFADSGLLGFLMWTVIVSLSSPFSQSE